MTRTTLAAALATLRLYHDDPEAEQVAELLDDGWLMLAAVEVRAGDKIAHITGAGTDRALHTARVANVNHDKTVITVTGGTIAADPLDLVLVQLGHSDPTCRGMAQ